jgi:hypothetical protein
VFGRRNRKVEEEAAREADRRALFEELAKRPDTVCPFLGMVDARTRFTDGFAAEHRCYAFGDPAELSAEQQTKVCLQRGYGNCPRYLRGVLVIPTEELEALRRPQPNVPRPAPVAPVVPAAQPARAAHGRGIFAILGGLVLAAAAGGGVLWYLGNQVQSSAAQASLPAGTTLSAELVSLSAPAGDEQMLHATAGIGDAVAVPNTTLIYVLDLSASTFRGAACGGDRNHDGAKDTPLDCEIAAATALNTQAIANGTVGEVGLVGFAGGATIADLSETSGPQGLIGPDVDGDGDGKPNVVEALESAFSAAGGEPVGFRSYTEGTTDNTTTAFSAGITAACDILAETANPNRLVVFLSDGAQDNRGGVDVASVLPCDPAAVFQTFAAGRQASCEEASPMGGLDVIAERSEGTCTAVTDLTLLPEVLGAVVVPKLTRVELTVDDGEPIDVSESVSDTLPRSGPASVEIDHGIPALSAGDHDLCLTVYGSDAGGTGSVRSCATVDGAGGSLTSRN